MGETMNKAAARIDERLRIRRRLDAILTRRHIGVARRVAAAIEDDVVEHAVRVAIRGVPSAARVAACDSADSTMLTAPSGSVAVAIVPSAWNWFDPGVHAPARHRLPVTHWFGFGQGDWSGSGDATHVVPMHEAIVHAVDVDAHAVGSQKPASTPASTGPPPSCAPPASIGPPSIWPPPSSGGPASAAPHGGTSSKSRRAQGRLPATIENSLQWRRIFADGGR